MSRAAFSRNIVNEARGAELSVAERLKRGGSKKMAVRSGRAAGDIYYVQEAGVQTE